MSEKLRPCPNPWCKRNDVTVHGPDMVSDTYCVGCECGIGGPECATESEAVAAWNARADADWTQEAPLEQAWYWHWNGNPDAEGAFKVYRHQHAETDPNTPIRMYIALKLMRAWNNGTEGFDGLLVKTVNDWIDGGLKGPIPWVENPFFEEWAAANGYSRVDDFIGFRATATLIND